MNKKQITVGIFIVVALMGGTWYVAQEDQANLYQCEDIVGLCFKLSKVNDAGLQTRCYYNESAPTKYKNCKDGWVKSELINITGTETQLPDREVYTMNYDFTTKQEAEDYITNLKQSITYDWVITTIEQRPYSNTLDISGILYILKDGEIIDSVGIYDMIEESATKQEIELKIEEQAQILFDNWRPDIIIGRNDLI